MQRAGDPCKYATGWGFWWFVSQTIAGQVQTARPYLLSSYMCTASMTPLMMLASACPRRLVWRLEAVAVAVALVTEGEAQATSDALQSPIASMTEWYRLSRWMTKLAMPHFRLHGTLNPVQSGNSAGYLINSSIQACLDGREGLCDRIMAAPDPTSELSRLQKPDDVKKLVRQDGGDDCLGCRIVGMFSFLFGW